MHDAPFDAGARLPFAFRRPGEGVLRVAQVAGGEGEPVGGRVAVGQVSEVEREAHGDVSLGYGVLRDVGLLAVPDDAIAAHGGRFIARGLPEAPLGDDLG